ncbi:MAG: thymidine phosphorylase, partial [archaeon]
EAIAEKIMRYGSLLGMEIKCIITPGYDPIGQAVGPALEAREVLRILEGENVSPDLKEKSIVMAGILLESGGKVKNGEGAALARKILESGEALEKFREIIKYQKGDPRVTSKDVEVGKYTETLKSDRDGRIHYIDIKKIAKIARAAGAPKNKKAGLYFYVEKGDKVKKGQELLTVYAETEEKLQSALDLYQKLQPIEFEKIILGEFTTEQKPKIYTL